MISLAQAAYALYGAWRLVLLRRDGFGYFGTTGQDAARSFWAAAVALPLYAAIKLLSIDYGASAAPALKIFLVEVVRYVFDWAAYPLLAIQVAAVSGCGGRAMHYVAAYNWTAVPMAALALAATLLAALDVLPVDVMRTLWLSITLAILGFRWFLARQALGISAAGAAGLVGLDLLISLVIERVAFGMIG